MLLPPTYDQLRRAVFGDSTSHLEYGIETGAPCCWFFPSHSRRQLSPQASSDTWFRAAAMNKAMPSPRPRILLADDHQLVLQRVTALLETVFDVVGAARDGHEMVAEALRLQPDVIVADISMPGLSGIDAAHQLRQRGSKAKLVFLTIHAEDEFLNACLAECAMGYVVKAHMKKDLIPAINAAISGRSFISPS